MTSFGLDLLCTSKINKRGLNLQPILKQLNWIYGAFKLLAAF